MRFLTIAILTIFAMAPVTARERFHFVLDPASRYGFESMGSAGITPAEFVLRDEQRVWLCRVFADALMLDGRAALCRPVLADFLYVPIIAEDPNLGKPEPAR